MSNLIVLVESEIKHEILHKNIEKLELEVTVLYKKNVQENDYFTTRYNEQSVAIKLQK